MRSLLLSVGALALIGSAALADDMVIKSGPGPIVEHRAADEGTTTKKVIHHADGCTTKSVTHKDSDTGDSVTHKKSDC